MLDAVRTKSDDYRVCKTYRTVGQFVERLKTSTKVWCEDPIA